MRRLIKGIGRQELRTKARTQTMCDKLDNLIEQLQPSASPPDRFSAPVIPEGSICEVCVYRRTRHYARGDNYIRCTPPGELHSVATGAAVNSCSGFTDDTDHRITAGPANPSQRAVVYDTPRESQCRTCLYGTYLVRSSVNPERGAVCRQANRRFTTDVVIQHCHDYRSF